MELKKWLFARFFFFFSFPITILSPPFSDRWHQAWAALSPPPPDVQVLDLLFTPRVKKIKAMPADLGATLNFLSVEASRRLARGTNNTFTSTVIVCCRPLVGGRDLSRHRICLTNPSRHQTGKEDLLGRCHFLKKKEQNGFFHISLGAVSATRFAFPQRVTYRNIDGRNYML